MMLSCCKKRREQKCLGRRVEKKKDNASCTGKTIVRLKKLCLDHIMLFHSQQAKSTFAKHGKNSRVFVSTWQIDMKTGNFFEKHLEGHPKKKTVSSVSTKAYR